MRWDEMSLKVNNMIVSPLHSVQDNITKHGVLIWSKLEITVSESM